MAEPISPATSDRTVSTRQIELEELSVLANSRPRLRRRASPLALRAVFRNFSAVVEIIVGGSTETNHPERRYLVHKELLTSASPFFAAALSHTFTEGLEQVVRLPKEKPDIFEWFLQWLYSGVLTVPNSTSGPMSAERHAARSDGESARPEPVRAVSKLQQLSSHLSTVEVDGDLCNDAGSPKFFLLIELWGLSDRLITTPLSNNVLSTIVRLSETTNSVPTPSDTWILYDCIRHNAPLRTLVLDLFAYKRTDKLLETHKDEWHPRFLRDLVVKLKRPGIEAIERHELVPWCPRTLTMAKACEGCRVILKPGTSVEKCARCDRAYCGMCLERRESGGVMLNHETSGCKPWTGKGMCSRYHDHLDCEACF